MKHKHHKCMGWNTDVSERMQCPLNEVMRQEIERKAAEMKWSLAQTCRYFVEKGIESEGRKKK